ncbi:MAG: PAS domain-containing protein [Ignavibacteria bacterium]|nr:PAS domain-containing protein [Ignavibacteria bacterium]
MSSPLPNATDSKEFVKKFTKLASSISEGVIISDEKEKIIWVNRAFEKISGYTLKQLIGKGPDVFHGEKTNKAAVRNLRKSIKKGETVTIELVNYKPDGTDYWIHLSITPVLNDRNKITKYIAIERDITEEKNREIKLKESEQFYKSLFEKNPGIMLIYDPETYEILDTNEAAIKNYGYTSEEFKKLTVMDIRPAEDREKARQTIRKMKNEFTAKGVWRHLRKNGEIFFVGVKSKSILYRGRTAVIAILTDLTDRHIKDEKIKRLNEELTALNKNLKHNLEKNNELLRELKIKEQKLAAARESAGIGTWEVDFKSNEITASEEIYNIFGFSHGEKLTFKKFQSRILEADRERHDKFLKTLSVNSEPIQIEYKIIIPGGEHKHLISKGALMRDSSGNPDLFAGITIDISEKRHHLEAVEAQLKNINVILSGITTPFFIVDKNYNLLFINDTSAKLSGFTKEELVGRNIFEVYADRDFRKEKKEYDKAFRENKSHKFETVYLGRTFSVHLYPSEIGLAVSAVEITENKRITNELKEKVKFIEEIGDNTPGGIIQTVYFPDGRVEAPYISAGFAELWGMDPEDVKKDVAKRFLALHPDDRDSVRKDLNNSVANLVPVDHKFRYVNQKTNEIKWVRAKAVPNKKEDGRVVLNGVFLDITESEKYYNELEKSNRRYEYVSKAANEVIWDWDLKTNILELAGNYKEMFGYDFPDNKVHFHFVFSKIHPDDVETVMKNIEFGITDFENNHRDNYYRMFNSKNEIIHVYERSYTIFDPVTNEPLKIIGTTQDVTLRKEHEEEIQQKAKFIQSISNNIPGAIFQSVYCPDGTSRMTFASQGFKDLWGMPVEEAMEDSQKRFIPIHKDDIERIKNEVNNSLKNLTPLDCKFRFVNQETGKISSVRSKSIPEKMPDGSTVLTGVIVDVTDTEKYYGELEKSNERYMYISKAANETIWDWDIRTNILEVGGTYKEMFGYDLPDNKTDLGFLMSIIHPDDLEEFKENVKRGMTDYENKFRDSYFRLLRKNGETVYVYEKSYKIFDEKSKEILRIIGTLQDITQRKKDEEAIKAEVRRNNIIVESMTDPFFVIGKDLKVILANQAGLDLTKRDKEALLGKDMHSFNFVKSHGELFDRFGETMNNNETFHGEFKIGERWFDVLLYPSEIGLAVHAREITSRKNQQDELEKNIKFIKEISDSTPGFIFQLEFDSSLNPKLNYASENAANYWGFPVSDAISGKEEIFRSVHKDDFPHFMQSMLNCAKNLTNLNNKFRLVNINTNETKWMRIIAIGTKLPNGNSIINGSVIDITDAETYYTKLEQANQRYEHVSKATNNAIWELDLKKGVCIIGGAYEQMFGYKLPDNILTDEFHEKLLHPDDLEEVTRSKNEAIKDKTRRYWEISYRIIRKDGEVKYVNDRAFIVYDEETNTPVKIIGTTQDVTDNIKHELEQKKNAKFIKEISESMSGFIFQTEYDENYNAKLNYASKNAYDYWGVTVEDVMEDNSKLLDSIHYEDVADVVNKRLESVKNLTNMNFKFRYVNKTTGEIK